MADNSLTESRRQALSSFLMTYKNGPSLYRINGCGMTFLGRYRDHIVDPRYFTFHFLAFLFIPLFPLGIYLVQDTGSGSYKIFGKISFKHFRLLYKSGLSDFLISAFAEGALFLVIVVAGLAAVIYGIAFVGSLTR